MLAPLFIPEALPHLLSLSAPRVPISVASSWLSPILQAPLGPQEARSTRNVIIFCPSLNGSEGSQEAIRPSDETCGSEASVQLLGAVQPWGVIVPL